jgi:hypothetical protein
VVLALASGIAHALTRTEPAAEPRAEVEAA